MPADTFFTAPDGDWFVPTGASRGPWDADACHAGPPTALIARASELAVPDMRLARLTVELVKPVPMSGFRIEAEVVRRSRSLAVTSLTLIDGEGNRRATARGLHLGTRPNMNPPNVTIETPRLADAEPGAFAILEAAHDLPSFISRGVEAAYPPGGSGGPGPTTVWMRTIEFLPDERPSPFQAICPLADSGNATSRNADPSHFAFMNADLTISLHRDPVGEWFGSQAVSHWQPDGTGMSDAMLFDEVGPVGRAVQMLLLARLATD